ncbi:MAG: GntR family transcriptional regulator [Eubacteriales bacterium]
MRKTLTTYNNIYYDIKGKINDGTYKHGDRLPSVKELCVLYNSGDSSIRKSLEMLKRDNYIYSINRVGLFVSEHKKVNSGFMHFHELLSLQENPDKIELISIGECNDTDENVKLSGNKSISVERMYYSNVLPILLRIDYIAHNVKNKIDFSSKQKWISDMDIILNSHFIKRKLEICLNENIEIKNKMFITKNIGMFKIIKKYFINEAAESAFAYSIMYVSSTDIKLQFSQR